MEKRWQCHFRDAADQLFQSRKPVHWKCGEKWFSTLHVNCSEHCCWTILQPRPSCSECYRWVVHKLLFVLFISCTQIVFLVVENPVNCLLLLNWTTLNHTGLSNFIVYGRMCVRGGGRGEFHYLILTALCSSNVYVFTDIYCTAENNKLSDLLFCLTGRSQIPAQVEIILSPINQVAVSGKTSSVTFECFGSGRYYFSMGVISVGLLYGMIVIIYCCYLN